MKAQIVFTLCVLLVLPYISRASYTIQVLGSPASCYGGEPCIVQPSVGVYFNGEIDLSFTGTSYTTMKTSTSGFEALWLSPDDGCDITGYCGQQAVGTVASFSFTNGIANFENLMVKTIGSGYVIKFTLRSQLGADLSYAFSQPFDVTEGNIFKMNFAQQVGSGTGGVPFSPNPVVAITDRGSNVLQVDEGSVAASIDFGPEGGTLQVSVGLSYFWARVIAL